MHEHIDTESSEKYEHSDTAWSREGDRKEMGEIYKKKKGSDALSGTHSIHFFFTLQLFY